MTRGHFRLSTSLSCYNPFMDKVEQLMPEHIRVTEEQPEMEISDLPAMSDPFGQRFPWVASKILAWQRFRHRRLLNILFLTFLALLALIVILSGISIHGSLTTLTALAPQHGADPSSFEYVKLDQHPDMVYRGHTGAISNVAWSPDGKLLAAGGRDATVRVWDARTGTLLQVYRGHVKAVLDVAWSSDSARVASVSQDGSVQVWLARSGKRLFLYQGPAGAISTVTWSPNGTRIAFGAANGSI